MILLYCEKCKKPFKVRPYRKHTARCCSRSCLWYVTYRKREVNRIKATTGKKPPNFSNTKIKCRFCGKNFNISPSRLGKKYFCSKKCYASALTIPMKNKYVRININGERVHLHRHLMELKIGRKLKSNECVHHINENILDNRLNNLELMSRKKHSSLHSKKQFKKYR